MHRPRNHQDTLQLANVCRQLRCEYFPLYYHPHVWVLGRNFARFIEDFIAYGDLRQEDLTVYVMAPISRNHGVMNILPFMRLWRDKTTNINTQKQPPKIILEDQTRGGPLATGTASDVPHVANSADNTTNSLMPKIATNDLVVGSRRGSTRALIARHLPRVARVTAHAGEDRWRAPLY